MILNANISNPVMPGNIIPTDNVSQYLWPLKEIP